MPGYNHYADCECGWCVNYGRSSITLNGLRQRDALTLLKRHGAKSIAGCFINPNARCPVCSEPVFFYANQFGSRVYFDDLGPPWPKHPCTDNPRRTIERSIKIDDLPIRRARGQTLELIAAANTVGHFRNKVFGSRTPQEWTLLVIVSAERQGDENLVKAEFLDSSNHEVASFKCFSSEPIFEVGDFISKRGNEISFLHKLTLVPTTFLMGGTVSVPQEPAPQHSKGVSPSLALSPGAQLIKKRPAATQPKKDRGSKSGRTTSEMMHFQAGNVTRETFCTTLTPVVRSLAKEGTRKPPDVASRLNHQGYRTACGDKWTASLVRVLLGFIFNNEGSSDQPLNSNRLTDGGVRSKASNRNRQRAHPGKSSLRPPLTNEEIAKRKAALNRITNSQNSR